MDIYTWGGADTLQWLFEGIKILTDTSGGMMGVIRLLFIITVIVIGIEIAFTGKLAPTARMFAFILIFNVALVSKTDVMLIDEINPQDSTAVQAVPSGLAWVASLSSTIGKWATDGMENVFATFDPNYANVAFAGRGSLFASRILKASTDFEISEPRMAENLSEFAEQCVYYGSMIGWFNFQDLAESDNIWAFLGGNTLGNGVFMSYRDAGNNVFLRGCRDVYMLLDAEWNAAINHGLEFYGLKLFSDKTPLDAANELGAALPLSYSALTTIAMNQSDIIRQNMMANTLKRSYGRLAASAGASAIVEDYAIAMAEEQQRTTYTTVGAVMGRTLPLMRNLFEALIYGIFPIVICLILISQKQGESIYFYIKSVFWLQLWAPLNAIMNFLMYMYASKTTSAAAKIPGGGETLNIFTQSSIGSVNEDMMSMAGYLVVMIPLLSWSLVNRGGFAASQLASAVGNVASGSAEGAAKHASSGNISLGNVSSGNASMFQQNTAPMMRKNVGSFDSPTGVTTSVASGGGAYHSVLKGDLGLSSMIGSSISSSVATKSAQTAMAARESASSYINATSSRLDAMANYVKSTNQAVSSGKMSETAAMASARKAIDDLMSFADRSGMTNRYGSKYGADLALQAAASVGTPASGILGSEMKASLVASGRSTESFDKDWKAAQDYAKSSSFKQAFDSAYSAAVKDSASRTDETSKGLNRSLSGASGQSQQADTSLRAALKEAQQWEQANSHISGQEASFGLNAQNAVRNHMASMMGISADQAARVFQSASNGNQNAMNQVVQAAKDYAANHGAEIAGVASAPDRSAVDGKWANDSTEIGGLREQVASQGIANQGAAEGQAASNNVPSSADVNQSANQTKISAGAYIDATDAHINASEGAVVAKGQPTVGNVANAIEVGQTPGNVAGSAFDKGARNAVDFINEAGGKTMELGVELGGKLFDSISGGDQEAKSMTDGQQAEFTNDLPPDLPGPRLAQPTTTPATRPGGPKRVSRGED